MLGGWKSIWQLVNGLFWKVLEPVLIFMLVGAIIWWWFATVIWPAQNALYRNTSVDLGSLCTNCRMEIRHPAVVLTNSQPAQFEFTLYTNSSEPTPLNALITIPVGLALDNTTTQPPTNVVQLDFSGTPASEMKSISLMNNNTVNAWRVINENLNIQLFSRSHPLRETKITLIVGIEGTGRAALRRFGSLEGADGTGSLFPLATILVSAAGLYYQELRQRQQMDEKAREQQRQLEKEQKQTEEQSQTAISLLNEFRKSMQEGKLTKANDIFEEIEKKSLIQFLKTSDIRFMKWLLDLIKGSIDNTIVEELGAEWTDETASALLHLADNNRVDDHALRLAILRFPFDKISGSDSEQTFIQTFNSFLWREPAQARGAPHRLRHKELPELPFETKKNPFPEEKAENDVIYLFGEQKTLFWSEHPLSEVSRLNGLNIIVGESGTGKTAIALAIGRYMHSKDVLSCYFQGTPDFNEIRMGLGLSLLKFIEQYPTYLSLLGREERRLLAQVLSQDLGTVNVMASLNSALMHSSKWDWLKRTKDSNQRNLWEREGITKLRLLYDAINSVKDLLIPDKQWAFAVRSTALSMKFAEINLVIDANNMINNMWLEKIYLRNQQSLELAGVKYIVFMPESKAKELGWSLKTPPDGCRTFHSLKWNKPGYIENWVNYRWAQANPRLSLEALLTTKDLQALVHKAAGNPGRFVRLWNQRFRKPDRKNAEEVLD